MQDNNVSNLRLQFIHENKPYNVSIPSTNETTARKITIAGKQYTYDEKSEMPENLKHILQSLPENQTFETEKEFLSLISKEAKIDQMSLTKRVYSLQDRFIGMSNVDTAQLKQIKMKVENELLLCDPSDVHTIEHIIKNADLPFDQTKALFEIADHIQGKGHVELAQTIRKIARPFDLEKTIHTISELFVAKYLYEDKGKEIAAKLQKLFDSGRYDSFYDPKEFAMELSIDLRAEGNDQHLEILYGPPEDNVEVVKINTNTVDHVGHFELTKFQDPSDLIAKQKVKETLDTLRKSNPEAIIIDLRENSGGNPYMMTYIASHFLEPDKFLGDYWYRTPVEKDEEQYFPTKALSTLSEEEIPMQERMIGKPIYILTSNDTLSAGESLTYHLKEHGNATIIGDKTRGGVHVTKLFEVDKDFKVAIPIGNYILGGGKENWEGKGITPDSKVDSQEAQNIAEKEIRKSIGKKK